MKNNWIKNNIKIDTLPEFRKVVSIKKRIKKAITAKTIVTTKFLIFFFFIHIPLSYLIFL